MQRLENAAAGIVENGFEFMNREVDSRAGEEIEKRFAQTGREQGFLGQAHGPVRPAARRSGWIRPHDGGDLCWTERGGAQVVSGPIGARWRALGGEAAELGLPVSGEVPIADGMGSLQHFEEGTIYWRRDTGPVEVPLGRGRRPTRSARLVHAYMLSPHKDVLFPLVVHLVERVLTRPSELSAAEREMAAVLRRGTRGDAEPLRRMVAAYRSVPQAARRAAIPESLLDLDVSTSTEEVARRYSRAYRQGLADLALSARALDHDEVWKNLEKLLGHASPIDDSIRLPKTPELREITPNPPYTPGQPITVRGKAFHPTARVRFGNGSVKPLQMNAAPTTWTDEETLQTAAPQPGSGPGTKFALDVQNLIDGVYYTSNMLALDVNSPMPEIVEIDPDESFPGRKVKIIGKNFKGGYFDPTKPVIAVLQTTGANQIPAPAVLEAPGDTYELQIESDTLAWFTIPVTLFPGSYEVQMHQEGIGSTNSRHLKVRPFRYAIHLKRFFCEEETHDEDPWEGNSDEIVLMSTVLHDGLAYVRASAEFEDVDAGDWKDLAVNDQEVFPPAGDPGTVSVVLALSVAVVEWDSGSAAKFEEVWGTVWDVAGQVAKYLGVEIGAEAIKKVGVFVTKLAESLGSNDLIGATGFGFSAATLQRLTQDTGSFDKSEWVHQWLGLEGKAQFIVEWTVTRLSDE